jgi:site-specific recombinase XerD|tara:strand:- start:860 stop:1147 length:288 start_codon:yes stop_codon:yes gene_type:complete
MNRRQNITAIFPKHLFWDVDMTRLNPQRDKNLIIPRALFASTEDTFIDDIERLEELYSKNEILQTLRSTKERISNTVCELVAKRYHAKSFARFAL